jgi:dihydrofolate reductase
MKKIKLYIATSIDGYIARNDGDLDWLTEFPNPDKIDYGYQKFFEPVDTIIMGGNTYRSILSMDVLWPYKDKPTYIITHNWVNSGDTIHPIKEDIIESITKLREEEGKDIWLVGGGKLVTMLLNNEMIDEMIITTIPVILGRGIPLFPDNPKESEWKVANNICYKNGVSQITYIK